MALTDKNILITPNIGAAADPKLVFSGADASTAAQNITLTVYPTNGGTLSFDGSTGQLFSVTNSMSGTIFSANDVSGIPSIEVIDTGLVKVAQYSGNVLLGTGTDTGLAKLQVTGSLSITGNMLYPTNSKSIYGPNTTWSSYLHVGGDGVNGISRTGSIASIVTTNGNMHIDSGSDKAMYLNHYSGTGGIQFGNGAQSITATLTGAGVFNGTNVTVNGNQTLHAGNYSSYALPLSGGTLTGKLRINGDLWGPAGDYAALVIRGTYPSMIYRSTTDNKVWLLHHDGNFNWYGANDGNADSTAWTRLMYLQQDGVLSINNNTALHAGNYTSYSPTLTGGSASGTWGINVAGTAGSTTGNAATVTNATFYRQFTVRDDRSDGNDYSLAGRPTGLYAIASTGTNGPSSTYSSLIHVANGSDVAFQIAGGYTSDNMYFRGTSALQNGTNYTAWRTVIHNGNYNSYSPTLTGGSASGTWGINITGNAVTASHSFGRTDSATYPVLWGVAGGTTQMYSCTAVNIQSSTGTLNVTTLYASANVTAYSDERVKTNWRVLDKTFVGNLAKVKAGIYDRTDTELTQVGVSAQSLQSVLPNAVIEDEDGKLSVVYGHAALVSAVELAKEVVSLNARIARLETLLSKLIEG